MVGKPGLVVGPRLYFIPTLPGHAPTHTPMAASTGTLTGTVTNDQHEPLGGVYITIPGSNRFAITSCDGRYTLYGPPHRRYTVKYFQQWYKTARRLVILCDGETTVDVVLEER